MTVIRNAIALTALAAVGLVLVTGTVLEVGYRLWRFPEW